MENRAFYAINGYLQMNALARKCLRVLCRHIGLNDLTRAANFSLKTCGSFGAEVHSSASRHIESEIVFFIGVTESVYAGAAIILCRRH